jgi:hypothetical protein
MPEPAGPKIGLDVGLKRGGSWTTFNVRPSRVIGPTVSLEMRRGQIVGSLDNSTVKLTAKADEVTGVAGGRVALDVEEYDGKVEISGVWNDDRVHFEVTPESLRGTITGSLNAFNQPSDAYRRRTGRDQFAWQCQFVLDRVEQDGARSGVSICSGMPEQTRLEFPNEVEKWLGRGETVVVLLALLASAPSTISDGPMFWRRRTPVAGTQWTRWRGTGKRRARMCRRLARRSGQ